MEAHLQAALGDGLTILFTGLRVLTVYAVILFFLRLTGKRVLGQFTPFDLLTLLLLSNAVQNAMIGPDNSLTGGLLAAAILLLANRWVAANTKLRESLEGEPALLIRDGQVITETLRREGVSEKELQAALREHGLDNPQEVAAAVLEVDGTISVVPAQGHTIKRLRRVKSSRNR